jgi:putative colanic acid biosynthesis acetyltransferase WcaF
MVAMMKFETSKIGVKEFILSLEPAKIGANACISQRSFFCAGNDDFRDPAFSFLNAPITIGSGAWVGAQAFVGSKVMVGDETVITFGSIVTKSLEGNRIFGGNPAKHLGPRWKE